jgi:hypothetical protein
MEPETDQTEGYLAPLKKVTPISKYLAMALFILMPFIGGWIGYTYAPEKMVEVEKIVFKKALVDDMTITHDVPDAVPYMYIAGGPATVPKIAKIKSVYETIHIILDINPFSERSLSFEIGRLIDTGSGTLDQFINSFELNDETGKVSSTQMGLVLRLHRLLDTESIETQIKNLPNRWRDGSDKSVQLRKDLTLEFPEEDFSDIEYDTFCKLGFYSAPDNRSSSDKKIYFLEYDTERVNIENDFYNPCDWGSNYQIMGNLIIQTWVRRPGGAASDPSLDIKSIRIDY